jgi:hypothetical protein
LENPRRIARLSAPVLGRRLETFARQVQTLRQRLPRESLEDLLHPDRGYASEAGPKLRDELHRFLVELPELSRLLAEGRGPFHREYLGELFFSGSEPLQRPYAEFLRWLPLLPVEYREANGSRIFFPTPNQVRDFARGSARPLPR